MRTSLVSLLIFGCVGVVCGQVRHMQANGDNVSATSGAPIEVRVGFLVGRQRLRSDRVYARPGRHLMHVFNYAIDKINQQFDRPTWSNKVSSSSSGAPDEPETSDTHDGGGDHDHDDDSHINNDTKLSSQWPTPLRPIKFKAISAETYGNESESIKQTIELMLRQQVHVIVGPQETCQMEPHLASIFDVPMISHYCSHWWSSSYSSTSTSTTTATFVQTKPPHWKIVQRVLTLVGRLLDSYDGYPQQLVLLYYKETLNGSAGGKRATATTTGDIPAPNQVDNNNQSQFVRQIESQNNNLGAFNDAIQYKLIGELLDVGLRELLARFKSTSDRLPANSAANQSPLTVLNWHTTFHYGYTRNPFRALLRRHLLSGQSNQSALMNRQQCAANAKTTTTMGGQQQPAGHKEHHSTSAIYIVVGHYYEHLGLMLSLDELGLLNGNLDDNHSGRTVVLGVDIEPYDERDDSVRFLRGLLMDNTKPTGAGSDLLVQQTPSSQPVDGLNSLAAKYNHYLGVFPSKPTQMAELLDEMRLFYNKSIQANHNQNQLAPTGDSKNLTIDESILFTSRLLQFIRLPVEAFYLYDSLTLLASYFGECLDRQQKPLAECQSGRRMRAWFSNRNYSSYSNHEQTKFDSMARAEGSYTLVGRRHSQSNLPDAAAKDDDEFELAPIGRFVQSTGDDDIQLSVNSSDIDQVWLPFWCRNHQMIRGASLVTTAECRRFLTSGQNESNTTTGRSEVIGGFESKGEARRLATSTRLALLLVCFLSVGCLVWALRRRRRQLELSQVVGTSNKQTDFRLLSMFDTSVASSSSPKDKNRRWFSQQDERNFLHIVQNLLLLPDVVGSNSIQEATSQEDDGLLQYSCDKDANWPRNVDTGNSEIEMSTTLSTTGLNGTTDAIELHCHMFPFPSCKFVHWLTALHQLKEMLFQFQSNSSGNEKSPHSSIVRRLLNLFDANDDDNNNNNNSDRRPSMAQRLPRFFSVVFSGRNNSTEETNTTRVASFLSANGSFFTSKHKGTQSLRLLLNKYKSINQCLCNLSLSKHHTIARLFGVTLSHDICGTKMAKLIVEQTQRNNLRVAMRFLNQNLPHINKGGLCANDHQTELEHYTKRFKSKLSRVLINDLLDGLEYLHDISPLGFHGELRITNCLVTDDWRIKLTGFHVTHMRRPLGTYELNHSNARQDPQQDSPLYDDVIYSAPEILAHYNRCNLLCDYDMKLADIYSFAYIIYELLTGLEPWSALLNGKKCSNKLLVETVRVNASFRPPLDKLDCVFDVMDSKFWKSNNQTGRELRNLSELVGLCWSHYPRQRPQSVAVLRLHLETSTKPLLLPMEQDEARPNNVAALYTKLLEKTLTSTRENLNHVECDIGELKLSLLPKRFRLAGQQADEPKQLAAATLCMFRFIIQAENQSSTAGDLHSEPNASVASFTILNNVICQLDELVGSYQDYIHLMDSQIDSMLRYLVVVPEEKSRGCTKTSPYHESRVLASFALQLIDLANQFKGRVQVRCALHCGGPVMATCLPSADVTGHNASRLNCKTSFKLTRWVPMGAGLQTVDLLEQTSQPQRVQISDKYHDQLKKFSDLSNDSRGQQVAARQGAIGGGGVGGGVGGGIGGGGGGGGGGVVSVSSILRGIAGDNLAPVSSDYINADYGTDNNSLNYLHQSYIIIKRSTKISPTNRSLPGGLETYWLLNGPRLSASQKLMLSST